ncbi:hypothetical protein [Nocardia sp. NPDC005366]|uniref:hypothetical protein n=1 Tax=Nocardia sp. NPDC005366 TaxID=3156878 RepID=UPI0033B2A5BC
MDVEICSKLEIIEQILDSPTRVEYSVRCLSGTVEVGDLAVSGIDHDGSEVRLDLTVSTILRYGRPCDLLDPPHHARLRLDGQSPGPNLIERIFLSRSRD